MLSPPSTGPTLPWDLKYRNTSRVIRGCKADHLRDGCTSSSNDLMTKDLLVRPWEQEWRPQRIRNSPQETAQAK